MFELILFGRSFKMKGLFILGFHPYIRQAALHRWKNQHGVGFKYHLALPYLFSFRGSFAYDYVAQGEAE